MKKLFGEKGMARYKRCCARGMINGFLKRHDDGTTSVEAIDES